MKVTAQLAGASVEIELVDGVAVRRTPAIGGSVTMNADGSGVVATDPTAPLGQTSWSQIAEAEEGATDATEDPES